MLLSATVIQMSSQSASSNSESSVGPPKFKSHKQIKHSSQPLPHKPKRQLKVANKDIPFTSEVVPFVHDQESTNILYLHHDNCELANNISNHYCAMKPLLKGNTLQRDFSSTHKVIQQDMMIHVMKDRRSSRVPKWPEEHNVIFGKLLLEQFHAGHISNSVIQRECWGEIVEALNRRLGTTYNKAVVMTMYKNMKATFQMLYDLSNRSGWGWDENLHLPIATEEKWEEIIKESPKMMHYRRCPFQQYNIFKEICGENIATETQGCSYQATNSMQNNTSIMVDLSEVEATNDDFISSNDVSYIDEDMEQSSHVQLSTHNQQGMSQHSGSKRSSGQNITATRRRRTTIPNLKILKELLDKHMESVAVVNDNMNQVCPYTIDDCVTKLGSIPNISSEAIIAVQDALLDRLENRVILMRWEGDVLKKWIEHILVSHPYFYGSSAWI